MSNEIIKRCSTKISLDDIFEGRIKTSMQGLQESIECCESWKSTYSKVWCWCINFEFVLLNIVNFLWPEAINKAILEGMQIPNLKFKTICFTCWQGSHGPVGRYFCICTCIRHCHCFKLATFVSFVAVLCDLSHYFKAIVASWNFTLTAPYLSNILIFCWRHKFT